MTVPSATEESGVLRPDIHPRCLSNLQVTSDLTKAKLKRKRREEKMAKIPYGMAKETKELGKEAAGSGYQCILLFRKSRMSALKEGPFLGFLLASENILFMVTHSYLLSTQLPLPFPLGRPLPPP